MLTQLVLGEELVRGDGLEQPQRGGCSPLHHLCHHVPVSQVWLPAHQCESSVFSHLAEREDDPFSQTCADDAERDWLHLALLEPVFWPSSSLFCCLSAGCDPLSDQLTGFVAHQLPHFYVQSPSEQY